MFLVLLPSFSSFCHIPTTYFTLCIHASFPSCWTNSAYLHTLKFTFFKSFSSCFPLSFELFSAPFPVPLFSQVRDQPGQDGLAQDGLLSQPCGTRGRWSPGWAVLCCPPGWLWVSSTSCTHWFPSHMGREGALLQGEECCEGWCCGLPQPCRHKSWVSGSNVKISFFSPCLALSLV